MHGGRARGWLGPSWALTYFQVGAVGCGGMIACVGFLGVIHGGGSTDRIVSFYNLVHCWERVWDFSQIRASLSAQEQFVGTSSDVNYLPG